MTGREMAWRVLAHEFQASIEEEKGEGERAASYVISPLGARMNRVLAVGRLSPPESVGRDANSVFLRARLADPTGTFTITAGGFQPRALAALQSVAEPSRALVVGKAHLFRGRDQVVYGSLRAEALRRIDEADYRAALGDALRQTARRIDLARRLRAGEGPKREEEARAEGVPPAWWQAGRLSIARYPTLDPESFRAPLVAALAELAPSGLAAPVGPTVVPTKVRITRDPPPPPANAPPSAAARAEESTFLDIVDELAEQAVDGYADLRDAIGAVAERGLSAERAEEILGRLEESGVLEEPVVGKLRRA